GARVPARQARLLFQPAPGRLLRRAPNASLQGRLPFQRAPGRLLPRAPNALPPAPPRLPPEAPPLSLRALQQPPARESPFGRQVTLPKRSPAPERAGS